MDDLTPPGVPVTGTGESPAGGIWSHTVSQEVASVRSELRLATADQHDRLDAAVTDTDPFSTPETYRSFLSAQNRAWAALRERFGGLAHDERWSRRTDAALALLVADLSDLDRGSGERPVADGVSADGTRSAAAGRVDVCPEASSGLALQYVFHGSAFGGRTLAREVAASLGPAAPRRFLDRAAATPGRWKELLAELDAFGCDAAMIDVARTAFDVHRHELVAEGSIT